MISKRAQTSVLTNVFLIGIVVVAIVIIGVLIFNFSKNLESGVNTGLNKIVNGTESQATTLPQYKTCQRRAEDLGAHYTIIDLKTGGRIEKDLMDKCDNPNNARYCPSRPNTKYIANCNSTNDAYYDVTQGNLNQICWNKASQVDLPLGKRSPWVNWFPIKPFFIDISCYDNRPSTLINYITVNPDTAPSSESKYSSRGVYLLVAIEMDNQKCKFQEPRDTCLDSDNIQYTNCRNTKTTEDPFGFDFIKTSKPCGDGRKCLIADSRFYGVDRSSTVCTKECTSDSDCTENIGGLILDCCLPGENICVKTNDYPRLCKRSKSSTTSAFIEPRSIIHSSRGSPSSLYFLGRPYASYKILSAESIMDEMKEIGIAKADFMGFFSFIDASGGNHLNRVYSAELVLPGKCAFNENLSIFNFSIFNISDTTGNFLSCSHFTGDMTKCNNAGCNYVSPGSSCMQGSNAFNCSQLGQFGVNSDTCIAAGCQYDSFSHSCNGSNNIQCSGLSDSDCRMISYNSFDVCRPEGTCYGNINNCSQLSDSSRCGLWSDFGCNWNSIMPLESLKINRYSINNATIGTIADLNSTLTGIHCYPIHIPGMDNYYCSYNYSLGTNITLYISFDSISWSKYDKLIMSPNCTELGGKLQIIPTEYYCKNLIINNTEINITFVHNYRKSP
jgi:hypothetical protein